MNIYDFAKQMERDGEEYYRSLADKTNNKGLKNILNMLADDEIKHYNILSAMARKEDPEMIETEVLVAAKNIFSEMKGTILDSDISQIALYQKAQDLEKKSQEFYETKASESDDPHHKALFLKIADEEKRHFFLLENLISFVSRPTSWLDDAEFNHLEEY
jgi:rubrerythrin